MTHGISKTIGTGVFVAMCLNEIIGRTIIYSYPNIDRSPSSPNKFSSQVASAKSEKTTREWGLRSTHCRVLLPLLNRNCVRPHPAGFRRPSQLFLKFCGPKHTCHSHNNNINPLNVFFYCHTPNIETIQYHFLNDENHFTVKIDSFVSECVSIHRRRRRRDSRVNQIICLIFSRLIRKLSFSSVIRPADNNYVIMKVRRIYKRAGFRFHEFRTAVTFSERFKNRRNNDTVKQWFSIDLNTALERLLSYRKHCVDTQKKKKKVNARNRIIRKRWWDLNGEHICSISSFFGSRTRVSGSEEL